MKKIQSENGITLVSLVVTIAVIIILGTVSITTLTGDDNFADRVEEVKNGQEEIVGKSEESLDNLIIQYDDEMERVRAGMEVAKPTAWEDKTNVKAISDGVGNAIPVPTNATYVTGTKETGFVIKDRNENEWVWVPVADATAMYEENTAGVALSGTTGVTTTRYSKSEIISGLVRCLPADSSNIFREPDILISTGYDDTNYETAGFTSLNDMASELVSDYITMTQSVGKYGGFYIGRYELTEEGIKPGATIISTDWYTFYSNCKKLTIDENIAFSRMVWGCQWDVTCNFIANYGDKKNITDSSTWGNYTNYNTANGYEEGDDGYESGAGSKQNTGSSENWKANNIYDFSGNCKEWTQEMWRNDCRTWRRRCLFRRRISTRKRSFSQSSKLSYW